MSRLVWRGVEIRIHFLFWVVILSSVWTGRFLEVMTLFVLVVIHELGHISAARTFGWRIRSLELLPFGGVVKTDEWGTVPSREEMVVALAGPFHNVMMVLTGWLFYITGWWSEEWTAYFVQGNAILAVFNLIPVYPLDGGRVLLAWLSYWMPYRRSIRWTYGIGMAGGLSMLTFSFAGNHVDLNLLIIALFLCQVNWISFKQKEIQTMRFLMHRRTSSVPDSARIVELDVRLEEPLGSVLKRLRKEAYHVLVVRDRKGRVLQVLPEEEVLGRYFDDKQPAKQIRDLIA